MPVCVCVWVTVCVCAWVHASVCVCVWATVRLRTWPLDVCVSVMPPICDGFGVHYMLFSPSTAGKAC